MLSTDEDPSEWWYCDQRHEPQGPIPLQSLLALYERGVVVEQTLVWLVGTPEWQSLGDVLPVLIRSKLASMASPQPPKRPLVYLFQHLTLREAAFRNDPELLKQLTGPLSMPPFSRFLAQAAWKSALYGLDPTEPIMTLAECQAGRNEMFNTIKVLPYRRSGFTAFVVSMPEPQHVAEAYFVAIVHKDDEPHEDLRESPSTRYFTLEKPTLGDHPLLCEWHRDGERTNYGEGPAADIAVFADAVFDRFLT